MNKEKILKEFEGKRIKDQGILPEGYKTGWNDCIDELVLDKVSDLIDQAEREETEMVMYLARKNQKRMYRYD